MSIKDIMEMIWDLINSSATSILVLILTVISICEVLDNTGIEVALFSYSKKKREKERRQIEYTVDKYIRANKNLFVSNTDEYIDYMLKSLGLKYGQLDIVVNTISDIKRANERINDSIDMIDIINALLSDSRIVLNLEQTDPNRKVIYPGLRYYVNFTDTMNIKYVKMRVLSVFQYFIETKLSELMLSTRDIDNIVIPTESNVILGIELAEILEKEPVIMHHKKRRIFDDQYWDGNLALNSRVIIVHDVIYSGDNITDCISNLPKTCSIIGVFSLINRTDRDQEYDKKRGMGLIEATGVRVYSALEVDDDYLKKLRSE